MSRKITALAIALASLMSAPAAFAEPAEVPMITRVNYGDLNLESERGAAALVRRVEAAARQVCPRVDYTAPLELQDRPGVIACRERAAQEAIRTVGAPMVSALYAASRGGDRYASN